MFILVAQETTVAIDVSVEELEKILEQTVKLTANQTLQVLLDLHSQLSRVVKQFIRTANRKNLPKVCFTEKDWFVFLILKVVFCCCRNYKRS